LFLFFFSFLEKEKRRDLDDWSLDSTLHEHSQPSTPTKERTRQKDPDGQQAKKRKKFVETDFAYDDSSSQSADWEIEVVDERDGRLRSSEKEKKGRELRESAHVTDSNPQHKRRKYETTNQNGGTVINCNAKLLQLIEYKLQILDSREKLIISRSKNSNINAAGCNNRNNYNGNNGRDNDDDNDGNEKFNFGISNNSSSSNSTRFNSTNNNNWDFGSSNNNSDRGNGKSHSADLPTTQLENESNAMILDDCTASSESHYSAAQSSASTNASAIPRDLTTAAAKLVSGSSTLQSPVALSFSKPFSAQSGLPASFAASDAVVALIGDEKMRVEKDGEGEQMMAESMTSQKMPSQQQQQQLSSFPEQQPTIPSSFIPTIPVAPVVPIPVNAVPNSTATSTVSTRDIHSSSTPNSNNNNNNASPSSSELSKTMMPNTILPASSPSVAVSTPARASTMTPSATLARPSAYTPLSSPNAAMPQHSAPMTQSGSTATLSPQQFQEQMQQAYLYQQQVHQYYYMQQLQRQQQNLNHSPSYSASAKTTVSQSNWSAQGSYYAGYGAMYDAYGHASGKQQQQYLYSSLAHSASPSQNRSGNIGVGAERGMSIKVKLPETLGPVTYAMLCLVLS
jgi:hypothetical protein